jgi:hypothetical protein
MNERRMGGNVGSKKEREREREREGERGRSG